MKFIIELGDDRHETDTKPSVLQQLRAAGINKVDKATLEKAANVLGMPVAKLREVLVGIVNKPDRTKGKGQKQKPAVDAPTKALIDHMDAEAGKK